MRGRMDELASIGVLVETENASSATTSAILRSLLSCFSSE